MEELLGNGKQFLLKTKKAGSLCNKMQNQLNQATHQLQLQLQLQHKTSKQTNNIHIQDEILAIIVNRRARTDI